MVAGSRSSLRRPTLRGNKSSRSRSSSISSSSSSSPLINHTPPVLPPSGDVQNALRSKRVRTSTISGQEQILKKRRLSTNKTEIPQLRIPLRSRGGLPRTLSPPPLPAPTPSPPKSHPTTSYITKPIDSPSGKPQYDQIRIIEERARASIRGGSLSAPQDERRKLRSEDGGSRAKTELAQYFPDFEDMLTLKPPDPGIPFLFQKISYQG